METKNCTRCHEEKEITEFSKGQGRCKKCRNEIKRNVQSEPKKSIEDKQNIKKHKQFIKEEIEKERKRRWIIYQDYQHRRENKEQIKDEEKGFYSVMWDNKKPYVFIDDEIGIYSELCSNNFQGTYFDLLEKSGYLNKKERMYMCTPHNFKK